MGKPVDSEFVAECFWPGVKEGELTALDERAAQAAAKITDDGQAVRYLGSLLFQEDEVVLCLFGGEVTAVREAADMASIPYERILAAAASPRALAVRRQEAGQ